MIDEKAEKRLTEFKELTRRRVNWEDVWDDIVSYVVPRRTGFDSDDPEQGERRDDLIYDGTPQGALHYYASGMQSYLLSSSYKWFGIRPQFESLMRDADTRQWLQIVELTLYGLLQRSNFYSEMHELFLDGGSIGTGTIYTEMNQYRNGIWFSTRHPREIYIARDEQDNVTVLDRYFKMTCLQMLHKFGETNLDREYVKQYQDNPYAEHFILHSVREREDYDPAKLDQQGMRYESLYIDEKNRKTITERGYFHNPYSVWANERNSDEDYGRGPGWRALSDIIGLNAYVKTDITATQLRVEPPMNVPVEQADSFEWLPNGRNFYEEADRVGYPSDTRIDLRAGLDREERKQRIIERAYMVDFFLMMANAEKEMTATEIRRRQEEKAILLGPTITKLNADVLDPLLDRVFALAQEMQLIPPPPKKLVESGSALEIDYLGPLVQAQRRFFQNQPMRDTLAEVVPIVQLGHEEVLDNFNLDAWARRAAENNGLQEDLYVDPEVVAQIREQRAQAQQAAQQAEQMEKMGKAAPGLGKRPEEGSPLSEMANATAASPQPALPAPA